MVRQVINLFMWGYQPHFRISLELKAKEIFKLIGIDVEPKVLLVGALSPKFNGVNPVCVEPEDGEWSLALFDNLHASIQTTVANHDLQDIFYTHERSMDEKPEVIHCDSVKTAVGQALSSYDAEQAVYSFCGTACLVNNYYVVPVIQIPISIFEQFPLLKELKSSDRWAFKGSRSFIHSCMSALLKEAFIELKKSEPGQSLMLGMKRADEIVRDGATNFMYTPATAIEAGYSYNDLFERFNLISSMMYEGLKGSGRLLLVNSENQSIDYLLRFEVPVPFREPRWARKILQMATDDIALIADTDKIYGLGRLNENYDYSIQNVFTIDFIDHYSWELKCGSQVLLRSHYGEAKLPKELISEQQFNINYSRLFPNSSQVNRVQLWEIFKEASKLSHGCMIVVAEDASEEVERLKQQGTAIKPTMLTIELLHRVSGIDGTIILDPNGVCFAVGVILDGPAAIGCTPSRGSRYNSAVRYIATATKRRMAFVVSDDHSVDLFPLLPPQIKEADLELNVSKLEIASLENYHKPMNWLDEHRFYVNASRCNRINMALDRIENLPKDVGELVLIINRFSPNDKFDNSYLV